MPTFYSFKVNQQNLLFDDIFVPVDYFTFGNLSSWGLNYNAQLGLNDYDPRNTPTKVFYNFNNWRKVSAGENFASAINSDGYLYVWGFGANGQLGNGSDDSSTIPVMLSGHSNFIDVSCGHNYMGSVKSDGSIWMWGNGDDNQLGNSSTNSSTVPVQLITSFSSNRNIWKTISCGYNYCFAISKDDGLWSWGNNSYGQLGSGDYLNRPQARRTLNSGDWKSISCGKSHTVGIKNDRSLYATGDNTYGQLGTGNLENRSSFIRVGTDNDWKQVSCGENYTIAIKTNGTIWSWGTNDSGQLGLGVGIASTSKPTQVSSDATWKQVSCGSFSSSAVKTDGSLWVWGLNTSDQLGLGDSSDDIVYNLTQVGTEYDWKQVFTKNSNFYAIKYNTSYI